MTHDYYVGFSSTDDLLGRLIRLFTDGTVNHAFLAFMVGGEMWTLGANLNGVDYISMANFKKTRQVRALFLPPTMSLDRGLIKLAKDIGDKYNYSGLFGMAAVMIARKWFGDRNAKNLLSADGTKFCSQFVTEVIRASGYEILDSMPANTVDPQSLYEAIKLEGWKETL